MHSEDELRWSWGRENMYQREIIEELVNFVLERDGIADKGLAVSPGPGTVSLGKRSQRFLWAMVCNPIQQSGFTQFQQYGSFLIGSAKI